MSRPLGSAIAASIVGLSSAEKGVVGRRKDGDVLGGVEGVGQAPRPRLLSPAWTGTGLFPAAVATGSIAMPANEPLPSRELPSSPRRRACRPPWRCRWPWATWSSVRSSWAIHSSTRRSRAARARGVVAACGHAQGQGQREGQRGPCGWCDCGSSRGLPLLGGRLTHVVRYAAQRDWSWPQAFGGRLLVDDDDDGAPPKAPEGEGSRRSVAWTVPPRRLSRGR